MSRRYAHSAMLNAMPCDCRDTALFFDFDGTLADIASTPETATPISGVCACLCALQDCGIPLAIISGRSIAGIDELLWPARLPTAGVHGCERRDARGALHREPVPDLAVAASEVQAFCRQHAGLQCEVKRGALTLHFRRSPQHAEACLALMRQIALTIPDTVTVAAKMAVELRPAGVDKVHAVRAFLAEAPFRGMRPVYFGDDTADEPVFALVQAREGLGVKIGPGNSAAAVRVPDPRSLQRRLAYWVGKCTNH